MPQIVLGTMTFGAQVDVACAARMLAAFVEAGQCWVDTVHRYNDGETERILGRLFKDLPADRIRLASKANPGDGGGLGAQRLTEQVQQSLVRLQRDALDLFYLHRPDPQTPVEETLEACHQLQTQGKIRALGLSNYPVEEVVRIQQICKSRGWTNPTVYQGMYNALTRAVEDALFPVLRQHGIGFQAYNPLAGGLLSGKYLSVEDLPAGGRFLALDFYQERYWKSAYFEAMALVRAACRQSGVPPAEAALRWLTRHSRMTETPGSAVILGASDMPQLAANLAAVAQPALPEPVVAALDQAWKVAQPACPPYSR